MYIKNMYTYRFYKNRYRGTFLGIQIDSIYYWPQLILKFIVIVVVVFV